MRTAHTVRRFTVKVNALTQNPGRDWLPIAPAVLVFFALPFSRLADGLWVALALVGCVLVPLALRQAWRDPAMRLLFLLFACYWVPMWLALPAAVDLEKSFHQTVAAARFFLGAFVLVYLIRSAGQHLRLQAAVAVILIVWCTDALIQTITGYNMLGMPVQYPRLTGVFGSDSLMLGLVVGLMLPLYLSAARHWRRLLLLAGLIPLVAAILLSGTRAGWVMAGMTLLIFMPLMLARGRQMDRRLLAGALCLVVAVGAVLFVSAETFRDRLTRTVMVDTSDVAELDRALSLRLPIWQASLAMLADRPLTGVGPRGFRVAYPDYAPPDAPFILEDGSGEASHAHQIQLSVLTETGVPGLLGMMLAIVLAWRAWRQAGVARQCAAAPYAFALAMILFPFNSHLDAYASTAGLIFWWLAALFVSALFSEPESPQ